MLHIRFLFPSKKLKFEGQYYTLIISTVLICCYYNNSNSASFKIIIDCSLLQEPLLSEGGSRILMQNLHLLDLFFKRPQCNK